jgi:hypothetical protein
VRPIINSTFVSLYGEMSHMDLNPVSAGVGDAEDQLLTPGLNIRGQHRATPTLSNGGLVVSCTFQAAR